MLPAIVRALQRLPFPVAESVLIGLSVCQGVVDAERRRRIRTWARSGGAGTRSPWAVALRVLVHRGRAFAGSPALAIVDPVRHGAQLDVRGRHWLERARADGGVILLGFHLGMMRLDLSLALLGHDLTVIEGTDRFRWPTASDGWRPVGARVRTLPWTAADTPGSRADALYRLGQAAAEGGIVMIMGDAGRGRVLFEVPLPGRPLAVRAGWFVLRRLVGRPVLPVLGHREGRRWTITIHPPLPRPDPDESRDRKACQTALTGVLGDFVARFPEQSLFLALNKDEVPPTVQASVPAPS